MREDFHSIRWPLAVDQLAGTFADEVDYARHVEQLMKQVLLTNPGERIHRPDFGCGLRRMVFAPNDPAAASLLKVTILQALDRWLGTVVSVEDDAALVPRVEAGGRLRSWSFGRGAQRRSLLSHAQYRLGGAAWRAVRSAAPASSAFR